MIEYGPSYCSNREYNLMETTELSTIVVLSLSIYQIQTPFQPCCCFADNIPKNLELCEQEGTVRHPFYVLNVFIT